MEEGRGWKVLGTEGGKFRAVDTSGGSGGALTVSCPLLFSSRFGFESIDSSGTCMRTMRRSSHVWRSDSFAFYSPSPDILAMLVFYICSPCRCIVYFRSGCFRSSPPPTFLSLCLPPPCFVLFRSLCCFLKNAPCPWHGRTYVYDIDLYHGC